MEKLRRSLQGLDASFEGRYPFLQAMCFNLVKTLFQTAQRFRDHDEFLPGPACSTFQFCDNAMEQVQPQLHGSKYRAVFFDRRFHRYQSNRSSVLHRYQSLEALIHAVKPRTVVFQNFADCRQSDFVYRHGKSSENTKGEWRLSLWIPAD